GTGARAPSGAGRRGRCVQGAEGRVGNELELGTAEGQAVVEGAETQDDVDRLRIRAEGEVERRPQSLHLRRLAVANDGEADRAEQSVEVLVDVPVVAIERADIGPVRARQAVRVLEHVAGAGVDAYGRPLEYLVVGTISST